MNALLLTNRTVQEEKISVMEKSMMRHIPIT